MKTQPRKQGATVKAPPFLIPFALPGSKESIVAEERLEWWSEQLEKRGRGKGFKIFSSGTLEKDLAFLRKIKTDSPLDPNSKKQFLRRAVITHLARKLAGTAVATRDLWTAKQLVNAVSAAVEYLDQAQRHRPELFSDLIKNRWYWPVLISPADKPPIDAAYQKEDLAADLLARQGYKKRFVEKHHRSSLWAIGIKETLERNRTLVALLLDKPPGLAPKWMLPILESAPEWVALAAELPPLSRSTVNLWMAVGKLMLVHQRPAFDEDPAWLDCDRRAQQRTKEGGKYRGYKRGYIFDSITKALQSIAKE